MFGCGVLEVDQSVSIVDSYMQQSEHFEPEDARLLYAYGIA